MPGDVYITIVWLIVSFMITTAIFMGITFALIHFDIIHRPNNDITPAIVAAIVLTLLSALAGGTGIKTSTTGPHQIVPSSSLRVSIDFDKSRLSVSDMKSGSEVEYNVEKWDGQVSTTNFDDYKSISISDTRDTIKYFWIELDEISRGYTVKLEPKKDNSSEFNKLVSEFGPGEEVGSE